LFQSYYLYLQNIFEVVTGKSKMFTQYKLQNLVSSLKRNSSMVQKQQSCNHSSIILESYNAQLIIKPTELQLLGTIEGTGEVLDQLHLLGEWDVQLHDTPDKYYHYTIHPKISVYITFLPSEAVDSTDSDDDTDDVADRVVHDDTDEDFDDRVRVRLIYDPEDGCCYPWLHNNSYNEESYPEDMSESDDDEIEIMSHPGILQVGSFLDLTGSDDNLDSDLDEIMDEIESFNNVTFSSVKSYVPEEASVCFIGTTIEV
jgi:hypothetical protein